MTTWLITGCSTGLGRALATAVLAAGHRAVVTARNAGTLAELVDAHPDTALALDLDVTDADRIRAVVAEGEQRFGGIDVLVNNAGYGFRSAIEEADDADVQRLFATNVFGAVHAIQAVLPGMRARRSGTIISISSIAALLTPAGSGFYAASKAALEGVMGSLRSEVAPLGIRAISVAPGGFRTDFGGRSLTQSAEPIADYAETAGARRKEVSADSSGAPGDPALAAAALIRLAEAEEPPAFTLLGSDALQAYATARAARDADVDAWRELSASTDVVAG